MTDIETTPAPESYGRDWIVADNGAAVFTWPDNGQAMRVAAVSDLGNREVAHTGGLRVRCIPRTKTGRDWKGDYGRWLPLDVLPTEFAARLTAALADTERS